MYIMFSPDTILYTMSSIFMYYTGFNYVKIWSDLVSISSVHFDVNISANVEGRVFEWSDFWVRKVGALPSGLRYDIEPMYSTFLRLIFNIF